MTNADQIRVYDRLNAIASCFGAPPPHEVQDAVHDAWLQIYDAGNPDADPQVIFGRALRRNRSRVLVAARDPDSHL